jgi:formate hydrogenlyase transcriptional activator
MTLDPERRYAALVRLCGAVASLADPRTLFEEAAATLHEATDCDRASCLFADHDLLGPSDLAVEFRDSACAFEMPVSPNRGATVRWVLTHRQPRLVRQQDSATLSAAESDLFEKGYQEVHYWPLLCRDNIIGVLAMASSQADRVRVWDQELVAQLALLLALALDNLRGRAQAANLQRFQQESAFLRDAIKVERDLRSLAGESGAMKAVRLAVQQVAATDSTVLLLGETGTGKELIARAIHQLSPRRDHLLVSVNCAALAPGVIASELFGHEAGAFTGAVKRRIGRFELAQHGTLLLDEIGELPLETQVMLLRVLQERVIERVGGHEPIAIDVRVIAATHQDLTAAIGRGRFRSDLFFRLNVFPIQVPPLRERREDIPDLVRHFLLHLGRRMNKVVARVSPAALHRLMAYAWPGNVRELENIIERALIVSTGDTLEVDPHWLKPAANPPVATSNLAELERGAIVAALARCQGRIYGPAGAAAALGLKPTTLYGKMRKHHIARQQARPDADG